MNFDFHGGIKMVKKIKMRVELNGGDIVTVPEWVKTEGDLEKFTYEYANRNISIGYDLLDESMNQDEFLEQVTSAYVDAEKCGFDSIVVAIDTDLDTTYYINDTLDGFQCDLWDYYFDDLETIASQLYNEMHGSVTEIRIE